jgi:hypothetical protein
MQPTLRYRVHGINEVPKTRKVMFEGNEVEAVMHALEVELSWDDKDGRDHGSMTLRFMGAEEVNRARSVFAVDGHVEAHFSKVTPEPENS